jgi:Imm-5 like putative immunity protein
MTSEIPLSLEDLRAVAGFAAECAEEVLHVFEGARPGDSRPREAVDAAWEFARGGKRGKVLRDTAWAAQRAAGEADTAAASGASRATSGAARPESSAARLPGRAARPASGAARAAGDAARAAMAAAGSAYLHPLPDAHQVKHILGAAAYAARAAELLAGDDRAVGAARIQHAHRRAIPAVVAVLRRYPAAPPGGGRVGELMRDLDVALRSGS